MIAYVFYLLIAYFFSSRAAKGTISMIKEVGLASPRYPNGYIKPAKWMKKLYRIKSRVIPKFLYAEFFFPVIFAASFPINCIIYYVLSDLPDIGGILTMIQMGLAFLHVTINAVGYFAYRK